MSARTLAHVSPISRITAWALRRARRGVRFRKYNQSVLTTFGNNGHALLPGRPVAVGWASASLPTSPSPFYHNQTFTLAAARGREGAARHKFTARSPFSPCLSVYTNEASKASESERRTGSIEIRHCTLTYTHRNASILL